MIRVLALLLIATLAAPGSAGATPSPGPSPEASPASGKAPRKKVKKPSGKAKEREKEKEGQAEKGSGEDSESSPGKGKGKVKSKGSHRASSRTGEEAPIRPVEEDLKGVLAPGAVPATSRSPEELLTRMIKSPSNPLEQDMALMFLGYLDDRTHAGLLKSRITEAKDDPVALLPIISTLVDAYQDGSYKDVLVKVVENPGMAAFQRLWALEILSDLGDSSHLDSLKEIARSTSADTSDRLRALELLADLGDTTSYDQARTLSEDGDLFPGTRYRFQLVMNRMKPGSATRALVSSLRSTKMSLDERLELSERMAQCGMTEVKPFLLDVVDHHGDTVFDQLKALHSLALLGDTSRHKVLYRIVQTKKNSASTAHIVLLLMGDRSHVGELVSNAEKGDLEALKSLVVARIMDQKKLTAAQLIKEPRYRSLLRP